MTMPMAMPQGREEAGGAGALLRSWRERRRLSQLALAGEAGISQRHLSFLESGRSRPSRAMVLQLAETLGLPLRERNAVLLAAGHAPHFPQQDFEAEGFAAARALVTAVVDGHHPHPALAVDRLWTLVHANRAAQALLGALPGAAPAGPLNILRLALDPAGLAPLVVNLGEWRRHVLGRLARDAAMTADPRLAALLDELEALPGPSWRTRHAGTARPPAIAVPLRLAGPLGPLSFVTTTTVFGTAVEVTLAELTIETLLPADAATARVVAEVCGAVQGVPGLPPR